MEKLEVCILKKFIRRFYFGNVLILRRSRDLFNYNRMTAVCTKTVKGEECSFN